MELDDTPGEATGRLAKFRILDPGLVCAKADWLKVEFVKRIEEVAAQFKFRSFADELRGWKTKLLS